MRIYISYPINKYICRTEAKKNSLWIDNVGFWVFILDKIMILFSFFQNNDTGCGSNIFANQICWFRQAQPLKLWQVQPPKHRQAQPPKVRQALERWQNLSKSPF